MSDEQKIPKTKPKKKKEEKSDGLLLKIIGGAFALILAPVIVAVILKFTGLQDSSSAGSDKDKDKEKEQAKEPDKNKPLFVFNGKDLTGFNVYLKDKRKNEDPNKVFSVVDGVLRNSGQNSGYVVTESSYSNYRLVVEYKWGEKTWPPREKNARLSYLVLHAHGPEGAVLGSKEADFGGYSCMLKEGMTGRLTKKVGLLATFEVNGKEQADGKQPERFTSGGKKIPQLAEWSTSLAPAGYEQVNKGVDFRKVQAKRDVKGYRGKTDVEKPVGEWNLLEIIADAQKVEIDLNGKIVNRILYPSLNKGKILLTSHQAELFIQRFEIHPLEAR
jgi:hypothetical protein